MKRFSTLLAALLLTASGLSAQDYLIEVTPDKKIIHLLNSNLSEDTPVQYILQIMPEMILRGSTDFSNFDLQLDGNSVGASRDNFLFLTKIGDLEKIEISTSSVSTQQKNGQSGAINFISKKPEEGLEGRIIAEASTIPNLMPSAELRYKKDRFELTGYGNLEYFNPNQRKLYTSTFKNSTDIGDINDNYRYTQATAKLITKYGFSDKDEVKGWILFSSSNENDCQIKESIRIMTGLNPLGPGWAYYATSIDTTNSSGRIHILNAHAEYKHTFAEGHKLTASAGYQFNREYQSSNYVIPHIVDAELKYEVPLIDREGRRLQMKLALNSTGKIVETNDAGSSSLYLSPLAEFKYTAGEWTIHAAGRYQMYDRYYSIKEKMSTKDFSSLEHDFIGNVNALWQFEPHKALRFIASRNLLRPTDEMLYPGMVWYKTKKEWIYGNPKLQRAYLHSFNLGYITDWEKEDKKFIFNAGLEYTRADGLIQTVRMHDQEEGRFYNTYTNSGMNDILSANLLFIYRHNIFSVAAAGNVFCNFKNENGAQNYHNYFNISITPIFNFEGGWNLSSKVVYNSAVLQADGQLGECLLASMRLDKKLRNWILHIELNDIFDYDSTDYSDIDGNMVSTQYDMYKRYFGIGATYTFRVKRSAK